MPTAGTGRRCGRRTELCRCGLCGADVCFVPVGNRAAKSAELAQVSRAHARPWGQVSPPVCVPATAGATRGRQRTAQCARAMPGAARRRLWTWDGATWQVPSHCLSRLEHAGGWGTWFLLMGAGGRRGFSLRREPRRAVASPLILQPVSRHIGFCPVTWPSGLMNTDLRVSASPRPFLVEGPHLFWMRASA